MIDFSNKLIRWLTIFGMFFMIVAPIGNLMLNYVFRIPALFIIMLFIIHNYKKLYVGYKISISFFIFIFIFHFITDTDINFNIILSVLSIVMLLFLVAESYLITLNKSTIKTLNFCSIISACTLIIYSFSSISHRSIYDGFVLQSPYLTFGYDNSNYAGIIALLVFSAIYVTQNKNSRFNRYLSLILEFILLILIYQTNSRTALLAALFIPLTQFIFKKERLPKIILIMLLILPFLFVPIYIFLGREIGTDGGDFMGKAIMTGRDVIYQDLLRTLSDCFYILMGNLQENPLQNAHNGPLAILVSTGIIGMFLYFYIFFSVINRAYKSAKDFNSKVALVIILACFLNTSGEAALLLGGFPSIVYIFMFFILANSKYGIERKN